MTPRRRSPNGIRRPFWGFKVTDEAAVAVTRYIEQHGWSQEGDRSRAINAMLATHPDARTATPTDTEEPQP